MNKENMTSPLMESGDITLETPSSAGRRKKVRGDGSDVPALLERAALDLFSRQNYAMVTIKDIGKATKINPSMIYYYYGSKEGLFLRLVENTVEQAFLKFDALKDQSRSPERTISDWLDTHIAYFPLMQTLAKISLDYATTVTQRSPLIDDAIRKFYDREALILGAAIKQGIEAGAFKSSSPKQTAQFISTFLDGTLFRQVMFPDFNYKAAVIHMRKIVFDHLRSGE